MHSIIRLISCFALFITFTVAGCSSGDKTDGPAADEPAVAAGALASGGFKDYNVVLISLDAVRAENMSTYGYERPTVPNVDKLAADSFVFERTVASGPWTVPATMSIFTGLWPSEHKVLNKYMPGAPGEMVPTVLSPAIPTIPEFLGKNGYRVGGFTGDAGVNSRFGYGRGFETYLDDVKFGGFDHSVPAARKWLEEIGDEKFFMFLHGYDAHGQYDPADGYRKVFVGDYAGSLKGGKVEQGELRERGLENKMKGGAGTEAYLEISEEDYAFHEALYDEKIQDADARVGEFFKALEELGLKDKTIVIVTADHGEEFGDHGYIDHGPSLYDELIWVPLVIHLPGVKGGKIPTQVRTIDVLPTVVDLLGMELPFEQHGESLIPLLNGGEWSQPAYAETDYRLYTHKRAVCDAEGRYKFVLTLESGKKELYDIKADPDEKNNLVETEKTVAYEMEQELLRWLASMDQDPADFRDRQQDVIKEY